MRAARSAFIAFAFLVGGCGGESTMMMSTVDLAGGGGVDLATPTGDLAGETTDLSTTTSTDLSATASDLAGVTLDLAGMTTDLTPAPDLAPLPPDMALCTPSSARCNNNNVEICDQLGRWNVTMLCPQTCMNGACTAATSCTPGAVRCNSNSVEICNSTGTAYLYNQTCVVGCNNGACTDPCTPGATRCNGDLPETCNGSGTAWVAGSACSSTACYLGACIAADLIIDGVTMTLDGDQAFHNSVIIRNGGQLQVGAKGYLNLRAKTVSIDASSSLVANAIGDDARGSTSATQCTLFSHCHSGYLCCNGATDTSTTITMTPGGASYGVAGCTNPIAASPMCNGSDVDSALANCVKGAPGPTYDRDDDLSISEGSKSGASFAGGLIVIQAESVTINGQVVANGTGSASGGGVLIAANSIGGTGPIQTAGGAGSPCGGNGRIKLLRGSTNSLSGSLTGRTSLSVMPPYELVSGSHPDSSRWYNDGLGALYMAWSRPFPTVNNYYWLFSQNAVDVPSSTVGRGTFFVGESLIIPAAQLVQGANWFHIISVDSGFNQGTVENKFKVQVNTQPPTVASASHPVQRTWYANNAVSLTWTNPQADSNFTGYYYVMDRYADTIPTAATGTFTTNKQVILANLLDGIWVYHLVNRDTRGATTRAAQHFVTYIGTEPQKGNVSGSVFDAANGNAPLAGVDIKINRGLFNTTTSGSGTYTYGNNLYAGDWEITASKAGYQPQTKNVTVVGSTTVNVNFTLTP